MKIKSVLIACLNVEMHRPIKTPIGEIAAAKNVVIKIETDEGISGWGEGSPMPSITGDSQESAYELGKDMAKLLIGKEAYAIESNVAMLRKYCAAGSTIRCAFDMALYDIAAKTADMPLFRFLGGSNHALITDHTIGNQDTPDITASLAKDLVAQGFTAIKLKTGRSHFIDVEHIRAVREAVGNDIALRIDCNQGWDYPSAVANIRRIEPYNIEYVEQPLAAWDTEGFARLRKAVATPICADESVFDHHDALNLIRHDAVDYLNIKLVKSGGIHTALKINGLAEAAGIKCMIGCFGESRLGLSAAAHLAVARPNIQFIDLDSAYHFKTDPVIGGATFAEHAGGEIKLLEKPGLGAEIDESSLEKKLIID